MDTNSSYPCRFSQAMFEYSDFNNVHLLSFVKSTDGHVLIFLFLHCQVDRRLGLSPFAEKVLVPWTHPDRIFQLTLITKVRQLKR